MSNNNNNRNNNNRNEGPAILMAILENRQRVTRALWSAAVDTDFDDLPADWQVVRDQEAYARDFAREHGLPCGEFSYQWGTWR